MLFLVYDQLLNLLRVVYFELKSFEEKVGECFVFKINEGCLFKDVSKEGKFVIELFLEVLISLIVIDISKLKEKCFVFKEGCLFVNVDNEVFLEEIKKCLEFKEGCVFKEVNLVEEIYGKMLQMLSSDEYSYYKEVLLKIMKVIYSVG